MSLPFDWTYVVLVAAQAVLVALPRAGAVHIPALARLRSRWWALVPFASIVAVVIAVQPGTLSGERLAWLALFTTPPLAAAALGWGMRGARPWLAVLVVPLFAVAWAEGGTVVGDVAALALSGLGCVTLGVLLAAVAPVKWLRWGIVAMAVIDAILVLSQNLQPAAHLLDIAQTTGGLPQFQRAAVAGSTMGYGDLFIAAPPGRGGRRDGSRWRRGSSVSPSAYCSGPSTRCRQPCRWRSRSAWTPGWHYAGAACRSRHRSRKRARSDAAQSP